MVNGVNALASWRDTATRAAVIAFVESLDLDPAERVAVFDNDGTLWSEKPMPVQLDFLMRRFAEQAAQDPALRDRQPWKAACEQDFGWLDAAVTSHYLGDDSELRLLLEAVGKAFEGEHVESYQERVRKFFATTDHLSLGRPYRECAYQPMIELLRYLESEGFATYIASGGDRDFMRAVAGDLYGVPPERVIGSSVAVDYPVPGDRSLLLTDEVELFNDGPVKPVRIWNRIGRRPLIAVGNSNGDIPMLEFAGSGRGGDGGSSDGNGSGGGNGPALRLLVHHDDAEREFAYDTGAEDALKRAASEGWTTLSMRDDWTTVFAEASRY